MHQSTSIIACKAAMVKIISTNKFANKIKQVNNKHQLTFRNNCCNCNCV